MPRKSNDPIKTAARRGKAQRRAGVGARCSQCSETRPAMLVRSTSPKLCVRCHALKNNKKPTEGHHLAGKANSAVVVELPIPDHRMLSEAQYEWPPSTLQNLDSSPLIALAAGLRGVADFVAELVVAFINHLAETVEKIDAYLRTQHGLWWKGGPFEGWQPGA